MTDTDSRVLLGITFSQDEYFELDELHCWKCRTPLEDTVDIDPDDGYGGEAWFEFQCTACKAPHKLVYKLYCGEEECDCTNDDGEPVNLLEDQDTWMRWSPDAWNDLERVVTCELCGGEYTQQYELSRSESWPQPTTA